jgi:hypothetical protein
VFAISLGWEFRQEFRILVASGKFWRNRLGAGIFASLSCAHFIPALFRIIPAEFRGTPFPCFFLHSTVVCHNKNI